jgi:hypothetical protein
MNAAWRHREPGAIAAEPRARVLPGLSPLASRALVAVVVDGPQPMDRLAQRLGVSTAAIGTAARALVVRGAAVRVPRGEGLPVLVASTGGSAMVRDAVPHGPTDLRRAR